MKTVQDHLNRHINAHSAVTQLQALEKPMQQLSQIRILASQLSSQIQLQAVNVVGKATQESVSAPELSSAARKYVLTSI
ncbi:hypothetical protein [Acaryochloris marina]|uniref:hypothetical protein n=1 Tax=Acaryochloris marina TaxID=155978 RepID=UPI001BAF286E|nr:hypothetical protein [Acaryochloris marina]